MRRVALAWEFGAGLGHVMRLRRLAARLRRDGIGVVAFLRDTSLAPWLHGLDIAVDQAPLWPGLLKDPAARARMSSVTMGDMLAECGLADREALRALLGAWDRLLDPVRPDLVIADFAPAALLAARGRYASAAIGVGFTLPPSEMAVFPLLHDATPPVWREAAVLSAVNDVLARRGAPPLDRLPQIFEAGAYSVTTFPLLDPYRAERFQPALGPYFDDPPIARRPEGRDILAYLGAGLERRPDLMAELAMLGPALRLVAPQLSAGNRDVFARAGARVESGLVPLGAALSRSRLVIHSGGAAMAAHALAAGVPQQVLSHDIEKDLTGEALADAGIGAVIKVYDPAAHLDPRAILAFADDPAFRARAAAAGNLHRETLVDDPLELYATACLGLLA